MKHASLHILLTEVVDLIAIFFLSMVLILTVLELQLLVPAWANYFPRIHLDLMLKYQKEEAHCPIFLAISPKKKKERKSDSQKYRKFRFSGAVASVISQILILSSFSKNALS